jgi:hypothetical protein
MSYWNVETRVGTGEVAHGENARATYIDAFAVQNFHTEGKRNSGR